MLILSIAKDFHKLFENGGMASMTSLRELGGIMEMTVHLALMFVIRILRPKHRGTYGARKVFNVVLAFQGRNIRATERTTTLMAE